MSTTLIRIHGTHCRACKALIEDVCKEIPGVNSCNVNYETGKTIVEHDNTFNPENFKREIESLGEYRVEI